MSSSVDVLAVLDAEYAEYEDMVVSWAEEKRSSILAARMAIASLIEATRETAAALNMARIVMQDKEARDMAGEIVAKAQSAVARCRGESNG